MTELGESDPRPAGPSRRMSGGIERSRAVTPDRTRLEAFMLEEDPPRITNDDFRCILMSAVMSGASDMTIQSDQQPRAEINGVNYRATRRPWSPSEVDEVLTEVYGSVNARTEINGRRVLDFSYEIHLADGARQRFRVNATGIHARDGHGIEITLRALPSETPTLETVQLNDEILEALRPANGIVIVAGATGSGKSTTLAAVTRSHLENATRPVKIVDIQAPIEYTFRDVMASTEGSSSVIGQSEVGRHLASFADGVRSALRRKPNIIIVGEARDFATISASIEAALTGHLVYTTTHSNDVPDAVRRLLSTFPAAERDARAFDLVSGLRFCMVQHLVPRHDGPGRVPVREWLRFTPRIKERLLTSDVNDWPGTLQQEMVGTGLAHGDDDMRQSLADVVAPLLRDGVISRENALTLCGPSVLDPREVA